MVSIYLSTNQKKGGGEGKIIILGKKKKKEMAVLKKKRSYTTKSARVAAAQQVQRAQEQQRQNSQIKHRLEESRLKSETNVNSTIHDESDSISFRAYLLKNFVNSTTCINALTLKPVALSKIQAVPIYGSKNMVKKSLVEMESELNKQLDQLKNLKMELDSTEMEIKSKDPNEYILSILDLSTVDELNISTLDSVNNLLQKYKEKFQLNSQDYRIVKHLNKFTDLKVDKSEAPTDYWDIYEDLKQRQSERKQLAKKLELEKKQREEEEELKRKEAERLELLYNEKQERERLQTEEKVGMTKELEQRLLHEQDMIQQQQLQDIIQNPVSMMTSQIPTTVFSQDMNNQINPGDIFSSAIETNTSNDILSMGDPSTDVNASNVNANVADTREGQELLDDMFGQYNNEQFNNGFDDGFDDLDNVFF